ncbi:HNH endonuclease signature motif containing protein [Nocardia africana]|uniref:HNH endonuclease signature motif containing protein n=1 Tax=Nocardia africana TaxID=134964 RepID=UPI001428C185|nr:HNH endonuclease signature motif containing protein [Nocardia africana]MCC3316488.1 HNH endonuclease [Nocardia africana]
MTGIAVILGQEAHIVGRSEDGPRGKEPIEGDRDSVDNLILLCPTHHTLIDSAVEDHPVAALHKMKNEHQEWVRESLGIDRDQLALDVRWARIVDQFDKQIDLAVWHRTIGVLIYDVDPILTESLIRDLRNLCRWVEVRPWPDGHEMVRTSLVGFARVINQLLNIFMTEAENAPSGEGLIYPRWYKISNWNPDLYHELLDRYKKDRNLMEDLVYEATRHLNLYIDSVRSAVDPDYREEQGYLYLLQDGSEYGDATVVPLFSQADLDDGAPYTTLDRFLEVRKTRNPNTGSGL